jgi:hypothetical protein
MAKTKKVSKEYVVPSQSTVEAKPKEKFPEVKESKPIVAFSVNKAKDIRHAVPAEDVLFKAVALQDASRFVGGWITLEAGKEVRARKEVIESLRRQGLVR